MTEIVKSGVIWDVETTGLEHAKDKIIEVGALHFEWLEDISDEARVVHPPRVVSMYGGLCDPGETLSEEIKKLTGITDADVKGKTLNEALLSELARSASIHVAHNADFDRQFIQKREFFAGIENPTWACTLKHIDWAGKGFKTSALNYLAADHGFVNPFPHRALFDCATTFRLMQPHFIELLTNHTMKMFRVYAWDSPFHTKDKLRERRYQWDPAERVWKKDVLEPKVSDEVAFLAADVYGRPLNAHEVREITL